MQYICGKGPVYWGEDREEVNELYFQVSWVFHNFVPIFIGLSAVILTEKGIGIERRKKQAGLGRRIFGILYMDGLNLKTIGNILCIFAIVLAILGMYNPWYSISVDIQEGEYKTDGMQEVMSLDGIEGVHVDELTSGEGMVQLLSFPIPFSYILALGIIFQLLATVGLRETTKLGRKYVGFGVKLLVIIAIILLLMSQTSRILDSAPVEIEDETGELITTVADSPQGGEQEVDMDKYGNATVEWGMEPGAWYLVAAGFLSVLGGICERLSKLELFEEDEKEKIKAEKQKKKERREKDEKEKRETKEKREEEKGKKEREEKEEEKKKTEEREKKEREEKEEGKKKAEEREKKERGKGRREEEIRREGRKGR